VNHAAQMLDTYPGTFGFDPGELADAISVLHDCAQTCTACADACLAEAQVADLIRCIRLNLDCADICNATASSLSRQTAYDPAVTRALLEACIVACRTCGEECRRHAEHGMEHCRVCAEACDRCAQACERLLQAVAA
jgi:hypothetical protein